MTEGEALLALVEQDLAIARAEKTLDELPEKLAVLQLRKRLKEIEALRDKAEVYCRKADGLVARANDEASALQSKIDSEQAKVLSGDVSNPKELQALTRELDALKRRKDAVEVDELDLMEKADASTAQLAKIEATLAEGASKEAALIKEFQVRGGALQSEIATMRKAREQVALELPDELRSRYEALRDAKHGIAVGVLEGNLCSACRTQIPAGEAQAIQSAAGIGECPNCRRMLVVRSERT